MAGLRVDPRAVERRLGDDGRRWIDDSCRGFGVSASADLELIRGLLAEFDVDEDSDTTDVFHFLLGIVPAVEAQMGDRATRDGKLWNAYRRGGVLTQYLSAHLDAHPAYIAAVVKLHGLHRKHSVRRDSRAGSPLPSQIPWQVEYLGTTYRETDGGPFHWPHPGQYFEAAAHGSGEAEDYAGAYAAVDDATMALSEPRRQQGWGDRGIWPPVVTGDWDGDGAHAARANGDPRWWQLSTLNELPGPRLWVPTPSYTSRDELFFYRGQRHEGFERAPTIYDYESEDDDIEHWVIVRVGWEAPHNAGVLDGGVARRHADQDKSSSDWT
jgi:hypothetical protein